MCKGVGFFKESRLCVCPSTARDAAQRLRFSSMLQNDVAFIQLASGALAIGEGPFACEASPPDDRSAFYLNDFWLSEPHPWQVPTKVTLMDAWPTAASESSPEVAWEQPRFEPFAAAFKAIGKGFSNGMQLEKLVPVVTEHGELESGDLRDLAARLMATPHTHTRAYGWWSGQQGMIGATPEVLMTTQDAVVETMALAGTTAPGRLAAFRSDPKEIREHELVVAGIQEALGDHLQREPREVLELDGLMHFLTRLRLDRQQDSLSINDLVQRLHPTPAVGYLPRSEKAGDLYRHVRQQLQPPPCFAAPFGFWHEGRFEAVVAIRNVIWNGSKVALSAGCGLIRESSLDLEWRELALKRQVVKHVLGLA